MSIVYVVASSMEPDRARWAMDLIRNTDGLELAMDWLACIEEEGTSNGMGHEKDLHYSNLDCEALSASDYVWVLVPTTLTKGAYIEMGYAINDARRRECVLIVSGPERDSIFYAQATVSYRSDNEAALYFRHIADSEID